MLKYEQDYNNLVERIKNDGVWIDNERTGGSCLTVINQDFVYDVGKGEVPLLTNKQCFTVGAVAEVIGYWRQYTNAQQFEDIGTKTWWANSSNPVWANNPNCKGLGDMGETYKFGEQGYFIQVTPTIHPPQYIKRKEVLVKDIFYPTLPSNEDYIGVVFESSTSGLYKVVSYEGCSPDKRINFFNIEFIETGTKLTIQKSQIRKGSIKDYHTISAYGVGVLGCNISEEDKILYKTWSHMLERCYSPLSTQYSRYGGKGVFVEKTWLNFSNFKEDVKTLENYYLHVEFPKEYTLDKDFFKSNYYSKHTCKWASKKEQAMNTSNVKTYQLCEEGGNTIYIKGLEALGKYLGVTHAVAFSKVKKGEVSLAPNDIHISYCEVNPLKEIYCKLKNKVDDRRLIATAWLPHLQQKACLVPCAYEHIWSLVGGKLSLTVVQRSCDVPLGLPYNSFSFVFLLKLMAKITGNVPDKVYHKTINTHIYSNQMEALETQMGRTPLEGTQPVLEISDWVKTLDDVIGVDLHAREYFKLTGYENQGKIVFPFTA